MSQKFKIACEETRTFEVVIEADDLDAAIDKLKADPSVYLNNDPGEYMDGSFQVNQEFTEQILNSVIESKDEKGYWNNEDGWGAFETATIFHNKPETFPIGASRFVPYNEAFMERVDE